MISNSETNVLGFFFCFLIYMLFKNKVSKVKQDFRGTLRHDPVTFQLFLPSSISLSPHCETVASHTLALPHSLETELSCMNSFSDTVFKCEVRIRSVCVCDD